MVDCSDTRSPGPSYSRLASFWHPWEPLCWDHGEGKAHRKAHRKVVALSFEDIYNFVRSGGSEAEAEAEAEMDTSAEAAQDEQLQ
jgi:hypothetical protein